MPIYEFKCKNCGQGYQASVRTLAYPEKTCTCGGEIKRVFSFSIRRSMPEHFNTSTGTYVSNERALKDDFKRLSDAATERTGIPHNYVPIDPQDKETLGVTDEGLDSTYDGMVKRGEKDETSPRKVIKLG